MSPEDSFCWEGCVAVGAGRGLSQRPKTSPTARLRELMLSRLSRSYLSPLTFIMPSEPAVAEALIISATPYQWKHMISQRTCRRNTDETRIVMLQIWQRLYKLSPILFAPDLTGPFCQRGSCMEKQMSCQNPISKLWTPADILKEDYPLLIRKEVSSHKD